MGSCLWNNKPLQSLLGAVEWSVIQLKCDRSFDECNFNGWSGGEEQKDGPPCLFLLWGLLPQILMSATLTSTHQTCQFSCSVKHESLQNPTPSLSPTSSPASFLHPRVPGMELPAHPWVHGPGTPAPAIAQASSPMIPPPATVPFQGDRLGVEDEISRIMTE